MIIKTLVENTALSSYYDCQHGLSFYVETSNHKILVDLGQNDMFYENAKKLDVSVEDVDTVIITHGHYDHGGGLGAFFDHNDHAKVYIHKLAFGDYYSTAGKRMYYIGLDQHLRHHPQCILVENDFKIDDELMLFTNVLERNYSAESNRALKLLRDGKYEDDMFLHEQNLIIKEGGHNVLFSGCAHCCIINILARAEKILGCEVDAVFAGFHLSNPKTGKTEDLATVDAIGRLLKQKKTHYFTGHCTGQIPFDILKGMMKEQVSYISTGSCAII
mgnify:CR=1 FL=1